MGSATALQRSTARSATRLSGAHHRVYAALPSSSLLAQNRHMKQALNGPVAFLGLALLGYKVDKLAPICEESKCVGPVGCVMSEPKVAALPSFSSQKLMFCRVTASFSAGQKIDIQSNETESECAEIVDCLLRPSGLCKKWHIFSCSMTFRHVHDLPSMALFSL